MPFRALYVWRIMTLLDALTVGGLVLLAVAFCGLLAVWRWGL